MHRDRILTTLALGALFAIAASTTHAADEAAPPVALDAADAVDAAPSTAAPDAADAGDASAAPAPQAAASVDGEQPATGSATEQANKPSAEDGGKKKDDDDDEDDDDDDDGFAWGTYLGGVCTGIGGCCAAVVAVYACAICSVVATYAIGGAALLGLLSLGSLGGAVLVVGGTALVATGAGGAAGTVALATTRGPTAPETLAVGAASLSSLVVGAGLTALGTSALLVTLDEDTRTRADDAASSALGDMARTIGASSPELDGDARSEREPPPPSSSTASTPF